MFPAGFYWNPVGTLAVGRSGKLFGVTTNGAKTITDPHCHEGCGTAFSLTPPAVPGGPWTETLLYEFNPFSGEFPWAGVVVAPTGVVYGTTSLAGGRYGTVFSLTPPTTPGGPMTEATVYAFTEPADGARPQAGLVQGPNGVLYGVTLRGGANGYGTIFKLVPPAAEGGSWTETTLYSFTDGPDGAGLALGPDGTLYGTTYIGGAFSTGTVFSLTP